MLGISGPKAFFNACPRCTRRTVNPYKMQFCCVQSEHATETNDHVLLSGKCNKEEHSKSDVLMDYSLMIAGWSSKSKLVYIVIWE